LELLIQLLLRLDLVLVLDVGAEVDLSLLEAEVQRWP
jgi:hypothetical protein